MKLRTKILSFIGIPIIVLIVGICAFGRFMVKNAMEDVVHNDLGASAKYALDSLSSFDEQNVYSYVDGRLYVNDFHLNSPKQLAIFQEVADDTGIPILFYYGSDLVISSIPASKGSISPYLNEETKSIVLMGGNEHFRPATDIGLSEKYYIYELPVYSDGTTGPIGVLCALTPETKVNTDVNNIVKLVIMISVPFAIIVLLLAAYLVQTKLINPVGRAVHSLEMLSEGRLDLTFHSKDLEEKDEIGDILRSVQGLSTRLIDIIKDILILCGKVHSASGTLTRRSDLSASHISQIDTAVNEIAQGATTQAEETQNTTDSIISIGDMISRSDEEIQNLNENSKNMNAAGDEAISILRELEDINKKTESAIDIIYEQTNTTNDSASKIREAINLITDIAEETNLLSLNASIEAARAGEQGRGFAVVAGQISKLAEQSNESAKKIEDIVASLIEDSTKAVATMDDVRKIIGEQNDKINQTGEKFQELKVGIENSVAAVSSIAASTKAMDDTRQSVVDSAQNLTSIAEENAASTEETSAAVSELNEVISEIAQDSVKLNDIANELQDQVNFFRLPSETSATFEMK